MGKLNQMKPTPVSLLTSPLPNGCRRRRVRNQDSVRVEILREELDGEKFRAGRRLIGPPPVAARQASGGTDGGDTSFILLHIHSLVHSFIRSFVHSLIRSFIHSFAFIHSLTHSFIRSFVHSFIRSYSFTSSLIHFFTHSFAARAHTHNAPPAASLFSPPIYYTRAGL